MYIKRHIDNYLLDWKNATNRKPLLLRGARQVGKTTAIKHLGEQFEYFIEANFEKQKDLKSLFEIGLPIKELANRIGIICDTPVVPGKTLLFLDEIQAYPHLLTLLKFLNQDARYRYIASGSQLGIALKMTPSTPMGSVAIKQMYPLDFEEFLWAMGANTDSIAALRSQFEKRESVNESMHDYLLRLFRYYLIVGGMPEAVNQFVHDQNIAKVRAIQQDIIEMYRIDASQYDKEQKLKIRTIYDLIPSILENKKKRVVVKDIQGLTGDRFSRYQDEFEYLISSGITLSVHAISHPHYPLKESVQKNLLKLYMNDVGMLTSQLYRHNLRPILNDERSINLGAVYENVVAQELKAHGHTLFYYDNRQKGEVDFLIDDYDQLSVLPIEVKSGKDYTIHSALNNLLSVPEYHVLSGIVLSNEREVKTNGKVVYMPIYYVMFMNTNEQQEENVYF